MKLAVTQDAAMLDGLSVGAIRRHFVGEVLGTHMYVFTDVASTNAVLRDLADGAAPEGTVVLSEMQRAGRGRLDVPWFSPPGVNLYVSVLLRPAIGLSAVPIFSFIASLALTEAIWALDVPAGVKWPNDVIIAGRKVAGTRLDVGLAGDRVSYVVVGVGVNVNVLHTQLEAGLGAAAADATSLREAVGRPLDRNTFAASFLNQLEKWLALYRSAGPDTIVSAWQQRDVLTGHRVSVQDGDVTFVGRVAGIDPGGYLVVHDDAGLRHTVVSAAVRLLDETVNPGHTSGRGGER
jgi:BirA family transcriptional regulator, biotin operon repressor / biotin---[acetyl-CoA-carboxylase] ligase